ncbi:MAG: PilW family protein [Burkholderiales bacterium]|nr:PilW family protein [Burkholderiales bacterium]
MSRQRQRMRAHSAVPRGFSLVELMVAMTIGLVLLGVVGSIFVASKGVFVSSDQRSRLNESMRLVTETMGVQIRQAAYVDIANTTAKVAMPITYDDVANSAVTGILPIFACSDGRVNFATVPWTCTANSNPPGVLPSDSVAVSFQNQPSSALVANSSLLAFSNGFGGDCAGQNPMPTPAIASGATMPVNIPIAISEFFISRNVVTTQGGSSVNIPELSCRGNGNPGVSQPLAQGIEQIRARFYVIDADPGGFGQRTRLTDIAGVGTDWGKVYAVQLCLLTHSPGNTWGTGLAANFTDCDGTVRASPDNRLRKANQLTISLRNRVNTFSALPS